MTEHDRRISDEPYTHERRIAERVSVLEIRINDHDIRITDHKELIEKFFNKFDQHITEENNQAMSISNTMIKVSNTVDNLTNEIKRTNDTLMDFASKVDTAHDKITEWDIIIKTIAKVAIVGSILVGGAWSLFTFVASHYTTKPAVIISKSAPVVNETKSSNNIQ